MYTNDVYKRQNEAHKEKNVLARVKHGRGYTLIRGCIAANCIAGFESLTGIIESDNYQWIWEQQV